MELDPIEIDIPEDIEEEERISHWSAPRRQHWHEQAVAAAVVAWAHLKTHLLSGTSVVQLRLTGSLPQRTLDSISVAEAAQVMVWS